MNYTQKFLNARDFGAKGSSFTTKMKSSAGSNIIEVENIGDFEIGDEVVVTKCFVHFPEKALFERMDTSPINPREWIHNQPIGDRMEFDGYDGSQGSWAVYFLDFDPETPNVLRWTGDFARTWHENVEISDGWTEIEKGIRVKIGNFKEREYGCSAVIVCDDKMIAFIEKIDGNKIYLSETANVTAIGEIMHSDSFAVQKAVNTAIEQRKSVFLPNGRYRFAYSVTIENAESFTFEGESGADTVIDNSFGHIGIEREGGSCFVIQNNKEVILKNLFMLGNLGFKDRDIAGDLHMKGGDCVWGFYVMKTNATCLMNNQSVYIENCHARHMSAECFYSKTHNREEHDSPDSYRCSITYVRCSVEDCARNAFNNNDYAENTTMLYCRVIDVGGCSWEGSSRFVKVHGCYFRNCGSVAIGNVRERSDMFNILGTGQHIITNNYFENGVCYGDAMLRIGSTASQIIVQNNNFINFATNAIWYMGECGPADTPCENLVVVGNIFDMTASVSESIPRYAINITSNFATISDNQIYVRGECDVNFTGIIISDDAARISVHDNTIVGAGIGIMSKDAVGAVGFINGDRGFFREPPRIDFGDTKPMLLRRLSDLYRGWHLLWEDGTESEIEIFDWETTEFKLTSPRKLTSGEKFIIYNPKAIPWSIHHNIIDNCPNTLVLDTNTGKRAFAKDNITN